MSDKVLYPRNKYSASPMSKPWTSLLRTHGSRSHEHCQRPQQTRWEFRRWDGALLLKAAGAPAEPQTQHSQYGISEMRFETPGPLGLEKMQSSLLGQTVDGPVGWGEGRSGS